MIADLAAGPMVIRHARTGRRHRSRFVPVPACHSTLWSGLLDDRRASRLKILILGACLVAAAILEVPW